MKMNAIIQNWYDEFKCPAGGCDYTCCAAEWIIGLMDSEIEKYDAVTGEFAEKLKKSIDFENKCIKCSEGRCNLLDENNCCEIYINCGEEYLSDTCQYFPRRYNIFGDVLEISVDLACPLVAERLFEKKPITYSLSECENDIELDADYFLYDNLSVIREQLINITEECSGKYFSGKTFIIFKMLEGIRKMIREDAFNEENINILMNAFCADKVRKPIYIGCEEIAKQFDTKVTILHKELCDFNQYGLVEAAFRVMAQRDPEVVRIVKEWIENPVLFSSDLCEYEKRLHIKYPYFAERYFSFILFAAWIVQDKKKFGEDFIVRVFEYFFIKIGTMAVWKEFNKSINTKKMSVMIASIDRKFSHSNDVRNAVTKYYDVMFAEDITKLIMMVI